MNILEVSGEDYFLQGINIDKYGLKLNRIIFGNGIGYGDKEVIYW